MRDSHGAAEPACFAPTSHVCYQLLEFSQRLALVDRPGFPKYPMWIDVGMPKLPKNMLRGVFFLYRTVEDAARGLKAGGTGFLVSMPSARFPKTVHHCYAVSNWHVAVRDGFPVIRMTSTGGRPLIVDLGSEQWEFHPSGSDVAVTPLSTDFSKIDIAICPVNIFATQAVVQREEIGPGDDVFMVGRFVDHDGGRVNQPAVRFGHISMMPVPMQQRLGKRIEAYCIDMHSRSGFSGSPVFMYRTPGSNLELFNDPQNPRLLLAGTNILVLLGIHFAQFPEKWEITDISKLTEASLGAPLPLEGRFIKGLSGMTCVVPAWRITETLNMPKLQRRREATDEFIDREYRKRGYPPETETEG